VPLVVLRERGVAGHLRRAGDFVRVLQFVCERRDQMGLGVQPEVGARERYTIDWGVLLDQGVKNFRKVPAGALGPAFAIAIAGLAFAWFGDGLARVFNPRLTLRRIATPADEAATS